MPRINDPTYINPADWLNRGMRVAPKFDLPDGRYVSLFCKPGDINPNDAVRRGGIRYIRNEETANADRFVWHEVKNFFPGNPGVDYGGLLKSPAEWEAKAASMQLFGIEIDEFLEGGYNIPTESAQYKAFTAKRARMYEAAGRQRVNFMAYGNFDMPTAFEWKTPDGNYKGPTHNYFRQIYQSQAAARSFDRMANYFANGHYTNCWPSIKYYPEQANTTGHYYELVFAMEVLAKAMNPGDRWGFVSAPLIETFGSTVPDRAGGALHTDIVTARRVSAPGPAGLVTVTMHPQYDFDLVKALTLRALDCTTDYIGWDVPATVGVNPATIHKNPGGTYQEQWYPDQAGTPAPYAQSGLGYTPERLTYYDMVGAAAHIYNEMRITAGVPFVHTAYTVTKQGQTTDVAKQPGGDDILFHAEARRGELRGRVKNGLVSHRYYNPYLGKHETETVSVTFGGKNFTYPNLQGGVVHAFNESL